MGKPKAHTDRPPTVGQAQEFDLLYPLVESAYEEISKLSQKKQDGFVNERKVKYINPLLVKVKNLLAGDPVSEYLDIFEEDTTLQNSDAALILGRFVKAMDQFRSRYYSAFQGWTTRNGRG